MKVLRFKVMGKTAFFKKPEVNSYYYFTYGNIHKVALLGMFGAILGYGGYTQMQGNVKRKKELTDGFPEFYERLKDLKIAIEPNAEKGFFKKKVQVFNNSVGYASKEQGGNLIVKEQWLEEPSWNIYVMLDSDEAKKVSEALNNGRCIYVPYLGKNDHYADIMDVQVLDVICSEKRQGMIQSLFLKDMTESIARIDEDDEDESGLTYKYQEKLPYCLNMRTNNYELKTFVYTDGCVEWKGNTVYEVEGKNIMFY